MDKDRIRFKKPQEDVHSEPPEEIIPGFIDNGIVIIAGKPASGKTFMAIKIGVHVASGEPWRGQNVTKGLVAYCLAEGTAFFSHRVTTAFDNINAHTDVAPFYILPTSLNLMSGKGGAVTEDVITLVERIKELEVKSKEQSRLVVFDTLSRYMPAGDENNQEDASAIIHGCEYIREQLGCAVMLLHHMRKDQNQVRGSTVLTAAADEVITNKMWGEKMIDGPILWTTGTDIGKRKDREEANEWSQAKKVPMSDGGLWRRFLPDVTDDNWDELDHLFLEEPDGDNIPLKYMPIVELIDEPDDPQKMTTLSADSSKLLKALQAEGPLGIRPLMRKMSISQNKLYKLIDSLVNRNLIERAEDKKYRVSGGNPFGS